MHDGKTDTISELLSTRAECAPGTVAIGAPGRHALTYRGLLSQIDAVVKSLKISGVLRSDRVAVVLPNGPDMAVTFLGVAATAVCAPLNPAYSRSEFEFYLSDLNPKALVMQSGMNSAVIAVAEKRAVPIIEVLPKPEAAAGIFTIKNNEQPLTSTVDRPRADDIALILHTSGTTSRPKMVPLTHTNLLASAGNIATTLRLSAVDRCLNVMPLFHIHGLVGALLSSVVAGASVICSSGFDIEQFFPWLETLRPTWYTAVPTIHHAVLARAQASRLVPRNHSLRLIRSSSSALPARVMQGLEKIFDVPVIESYGMTEAAHQMTSNPLPPGQRKVGSVGLTAGPEVSIMDEAGSLLSKGEIGEIVIRGANVMDSYDNNSDANGEAFTQGWFRTGDQGYQDKDGYLFITGRLKEIINRGGEKISPREVDEVILQHPAVAEAISFAIRHETLGEDIAAAVVVREKAAVSEGDLQRFVAAQLTEFKIPRRVRFVDAIPKNATGKPQRIDLAKKFGALLLEQGIHEFLAPQTQTEKTLASIWSEVLGVDPIGIQDNFFYLGGDSIRAAQVISRVRDALRAELSFLIFFEVPTIAGIAARIDSVNKAEQALKTPPITPVSRIGELPASFAQQSLWLFDQLEPNSSAYNISAAFHLNGPLDVRALEQTLNQIVQHHEPLRTTFTAVNGHPVQVIAPVLIRTLPVVDLLALAKADQESEVRRFGTEEAQKPFDLARGPLLRLSLIRLGDQEHVLFLTMHHIISDGWSMGILFREISTLYAALCTGRSSPIAELSFQYADFAVWQRQCLQGEVLNQQLSYWKTQLSGAPPVLELPTDRPRLSVQTFRGDVQLFQFSLDLTRKLKTLSQRSGATLYMTLLGAFVSLLSRYSAQKDIVVGSSFANRNFRELESLIGLFVDTLVIRTDLSGNPTFKELLARVRQVALDAFAHQKLPFEKLVEELQPERKLTQNPLFQVFFVFQNAPEHKLELPGLTIAPLKFENPTAKFDLMLSMEQTEQGLKGWFEYNSDLFNAATIARMSQRFEALVESIVENPDTALCDLQIDRGLDLPTLSPSVTPENEAPLSYHQERLWFIDQFEAGHVYESSPTYHNIPLILHLSGPVDCDVLEHSLNVIVNRHKALCTRIVCRLGRSFQVISPGDSLKLKVVDTVGISKGTTIDGALQSALDDSRQPFTMSGELLARASLVRMTAVESLLVVTVHHIVADKRSLQLIAEELAEVYEARTTGRPPQLAELILQYTDYARWQLALPANILEYLLFYWKYQLGGKLQALELPSARLRPPIQTFTEGRYTFSLHRELTRRIRTFSRKQDSCEFTVLLAGFKALLHRYTGQDEIIVGISEPCRNQPGIKNVVGPIANLLVLRSTLTGNLPFRSFLEQVTKTLNQARKHQEMPFDKLVQELKPEKDMSRTALFDVLFQFEDQQREILNMGDLKARMIDTNLGYGKYDINLSLHGAEEELSGIVVYNRNIYDAFTIEQMMRHFEVILDAMTSDQDHRIGDVTLLSKVEQHQQLVTWNSTQASYYRDKTIHQLFEEQAEKTPENTAVICGAEELTYRELDERANQLAHYLRKQGVASDTLVALELDRSPEIIVACLGVLKAGGAYLPMDPAYPDEQLRFMLKDARISHLITTEALLRNIPENPPSVTLLDADRERISAQPAVAPAHNGSPKDLAYCIYTSGSTGKPKGVLLEHHNVVRLLVNDKLPFTFTESDVWTMFHSYCFDFSVWEMYGALLYGGKLVIVPNQVARDPSAFLDMLVLERVTVLNQTPTFFYHLLQKTLDRLKADLALRYVIFGGEALDPTRLKPWKKAYPDIKLINMYGITETTVHVMFKEITDTDTQEKVSNIGVPIPTTTTYVMDSNLRLLPVGVPGEVYVGGDGVARGYLSRDELTRQKFLQNPYKPEERVYRSGDLAKLLPNGEMVYLGRIDDQVQIRGFRVELGAIQSYLLTHPSVAEAVVVATNLQSSAIEIVAYIVQRADITVTALREHLAQTLPDYMMPSAFVFLQALPLTRNGKVDRRALPVPDWERPDLAETFVAPNTLTEKMLAGIWSEILHVEPVGVHDNFFEIGGHSLLIVQVQRRLCEILDHDVSVVDLFKHPTISSLASFLNQNKIEPSQVNAIEERAQRRKEAMARRKRLSKDDGEIQ